MASRRAACRRRHCKRRLRNWPRAEIQKRRGSGWRLAGLTVAVTEEHALMIFRPFYRFDTGCAAYVFGCGGQGMCVVVDPQLDDVDAYAEFADAKGMRIVRVIDTHVHADHKSGGRALAHKTGAPYSLHRTAPVRFSFE